MLKPCSLITLRPFTTPLDSIPHWVISPQSNLKTPCFPQPNDQTYTSTCSHFRSQITRTRIGYASTRVDLPNVKYKPESQILGQSRTSLRTIFYIWCRKSEGQREQNSRPHSHNGLRASSGMPMATLTHATQDTLNRNASRWIRFSSMAISRVSPYLSRTARAQPALRAGSDAADIA